MAAEDLLQKLDMFFSGFPPLSCKRREVIFQVGDAPDNIFYVQSGYARVYRISENGEELTLAILKPHDLFPPAWGTDNTAFSYYLEAITPLELARVPREKFVEFVRSNPGMFYELMVFMSMRLAGMMTRIEYLVRGHAYTKVATAVLACAKRFGELRGSDMIITLPLTHRDIATLVGITRETTCLEMKKLEKKGLISQKKHVLVVKDMDKLEQESLLHEESAWLLNNSL